MQAFYIFSVSPVRSASPPGFKSAREVLQERAERGLWPLNRRTQHQQQLREGDEVLFYVAGKDKEQSHFVGTGRILGERIRSERAPLKRSYIWTGPWMGQTPELYDVPIGNVELFERPLSIRPLLGSLDFISDVTRWGSYLQGGVKRIPPNDFRRILAESKGTLL